jgi:acetyl esterase/lipase
MKAGMALALLVAAGLAGGAALAADAAAAQLPQQPPALPGPPAPVPPPAAPGSQALIAVPRPGMPPEVAAALREIGPNIEAAKNQAVYAPLHAAFRHDSVQVSRDLAYGPDEKHRADVFKQKNASGARRPLLVFVYGGGFRGGAKSSPTSPFFDNVGYWAAEHGLVGVTVNYRLAPQAMFPSGAEDIARLVPWLRSHAAEWGADPERIFLWGHSSGGSHVAEYLARTPRPQVAGAILMSGVYTALPMWSAYFGEDATKYPERSSLERLYPLRLPMLVVWAGLDPVNFIPDSEKLLAGRRTARTPTSSVFLPDHSHLSEAYAIGTADESLSAPLLQFIQSPPR